MSGTAGAEVGLRDMIVRVSGASGASVELRHAGRRVGVWVTELLDTDEYGDIADESSCFLDPQGAYLLGDALIKWAKRRLAATEGAADDHN